MKYLKLITIVLLLILLEILFSTRLSFANGDSFTLIQNNKPLPTLEEVLDKYIQAIGGKNAIQAQTSLITKGTLSVPAIGATGTIETYAKVPNKTLTEITSDTVGNSRTGFNGTAAWEEEDGKVRDLAAFAKRDADFYFSIKMQALYPKIEMKGREKIGTRDAYRLDAPRNGNPKRWYFDAETGLLIRTEIRNAADQLISSEDFEDYRAVDGVKIAFTVRSFEDNIEAITKLNEVKHNVAIDDAKFEKPTVKPVPALSPAESQAAAQLKAETIREVTTALVSKDMQGRGMAQLGGDKAAKYIADRFTKAGLKPGGEASTYFQNIKIKIATPQAGTLFRVGNNTFQFKTDYAIANPWMDAAPKPANGDLVFVGYGVVSGDLKRDDLAGIDVKGKIVVVLNGRPTHVDAAIWDRESKQRIVFGRLIKKGAIGFIVPFDRDSSRFPAAAAAVSNRRISLAEPLPDPFVMARWSLELLADEFTLPPSVLVSQTVARKIFAASGQNLQDLTKKAESSEFVSRDLKIRGSIAPRIKQEQGVSSNVIGVIEGSDPKLKSEAVVFSAHYDAFGIDTEGIVYPGAMDNAAGVGKLIAMAESVVTMNPKPRRSIIFFATTGEEYGDLGADYWLAHPTWPLEKIAADINYDCGIDVWGRLGYVVDLGFDHSDLNSVIKDVTSATDIQIVPDAFPDEGFFSRSDHYSFIKKGIPSLFLVGGPAENPSAQIARVQTWMTNDYHMPTDTIQPDWNWEGARGLAEIGLITGLRVANQEAMPSWRSDSPYNKRRGSSASPAKHSNSDDEFERISQKLQSKLNQWQVSNGFPGATIGFVLPDGQHGSVSAGFADLENKTPLKPTDLMLAGSIGKTFVAAVALQLAQENKLSLDDKIERWFGTEPWFVRLPNAKDIKVRNLLMHSSGLPNHVDDKRFDNAFLTMPDMVCKPEDLIAYDFDKKPLFPAGTGYSYTDTSYILIGMIIEKVTGNTLYSEVSRRLLVPLKLDHTVPSDKRIIPGVIPGYTNVRDLPKTRGKVLVDGKMVVNPACEWAGGGFASTSEDLARWAKALYEGKVLEKPYMDQMLKGLPLKPEYKYGLGVEIMETKLGTVWGHDGEFPGYLSDMRYFPQHKLAVAIQFNTERPKNLKREPDEYLWDVAKIILDEMAASK